MDHPSADEATHVGTVEEKCPLWEWRSVHRRPLCLHPPHPQQSLTTFAGDVSRYSCSCSLFPIPTSATEDITESSLTWCFWPLGWERIRLRNLLAPSTHNLLPPFDIQPLLILSPQAEPFNPTHSIFCQ